ncbi:DUF3558 family protein [Amycolatopsis sp. NBC_01480]|uniref:DUF3558 family protein n=1 Tax=Amycolatopsis sp. NBC_01480 TaxID=2903562 RepID=UPI002E2BD2BF|nr:DUF3558 family protein [Amycolatopsis sp. NBC_01480]
MLGARPAAAPPPTSTVDPLDLSAFRDAPCGLPGDAELARFFLAVPGRLTPAAALTECEWASANPRAPRYQAAVDLNSGGLPGLRRRTPFAPDGPAAIHGYPAGHVAAGRTAGWCTVDVGVAPDTVLQVSVTIPAPGVLSDDPCTDADQFAGAIIGFQGHRAP